MLSQVVSLLKESLYSWLGKLQTTQREAVKVCGIAVLRKFPRQEIAEEVPCPELARILSLPLPKAADRINYVRISIE